MRQRGDFLRRFGARFRQLGRCRRRFGLGFDEATPADFIEVDRDLHTLTGEGMANPATRFHLWVYEARPDVQSIIHTHSPWASALAAARQPLVIAQMDMTPLHDDCAFLGEWPGVPIADQEGVIISGALAAVAGLVLSGYVGIVDNWVGRGFELDSIVAAVMGGISLSGGRGGIAGGLFGAAILVVVFNAVLLFGLPVQLQIIIKGIVIVLAAAFYVRRRV